MSAPDLHHTPDGDRPAAAAALAPSERRQRQVIVALRLLAVRRARMRAERTLAMRRRS